MILSNSKSKVMKGYFVNITEEKFTIPVTPPEPENSGETDADFKSAANFAADFLRSADYEYTDGKIMELYSQPSIKHRYNYLFEDEAAKKTEIQEQQESEILAHMERLEELSNQAKEIERTSKLVADKIIAQAQRTADIIVSHTVENAKTELNEVMSQGYSYGYEAGRAEAMNIIEPALNKIALLTEAVKQMQDKMLEDFKDEMFDIISEISKKIIHKEINENDEYLLSLFGDAVKDIRAENYVTVTVSESQADFAIRNIDLFKEKVANIEDFRIIADENSERGTMIVETVKTVSDASVNIQAEAIDNIIDRMKENFSLMLSSFENADNLKNLSNLNADNFDYSGNPGGEDMMNFPDGFNADEADTEMDMDG